MAVVTLLLRAGLRQRWRSWLASAFLVALVGGLVLAGVATARATETAFPRYLSAHGYDAFFYSSGVLPRVATLPDVASATLVQSPVSGPPTCDCTRTVNVNDFALNELSAQDLPQMVKLVSGRYPDQSDPDEVLASFTLQRDAGVHVGTVIHVGLASPTQRLAVLNNANLTPRGPAPASASLASPRRRLSSRLPPRHRPTTSIRPRLSREYNSKAVVFDEYFLRLHGGAASLPGFEAKPECWVVCRRATFTPLRPPSTSPSTRKRSDGGSSVGWSPWWESASSCRRWPDSRRSSPRTSRP